MRRARKGRFAVGEFKQSGELFERPWACRQAGAQPSEPRHPLQNKRTPFWCPFCFTMGWARKGRFAAGEFKQSGELFERPWACRQAGAQPSEPRHPLQNKRTPFWCPFCFTMGWARKGRFAAGEFKQSGELFERPWACALCSFLHSS